MKKVFGYIRVSTVKQGEHGVSLQEQKSAIQRFADQNDLHIVQWLEEQESAAKSGRPVFVKMVKDLKARRVDGVIVHKIDRWSRNMEDWNIITNLSDHQGVSIYTAQENLDLKARGGRLAADIQAVIAADYIRNLRDEVKKGMYGRLKQGLYPWAAPIGYLDMGGGKVKEIDPVMGPLVREAFELYSTSEYSLRRLCKTMYARGLRNTVGDQMSVNGMSTVLNNPFYCGIIRLKSKNETYVGIHCPIIPEQLYKKVQDVLQGKYTKKIRTHQFQYRKMLFCETCRRMLSGEKQKKYIYYRCHTPECRGTSFNEKTIENAWRRTLSNLSFSEKESEKLKEYIQLLQDDSKALTERNQRTAKLKKKNLKNRHERLVSSYLEGILNKETFTLQQEKMAFERKSIDELGGNKTQESVAALTQTSGFFELVNSALDKYVQANNDEKRHLIQIMTSNFSVSGKNLSIEMKKPFSFIGCDKGVTCCGHLQDTSRTFTEKSERQDENAKHSDNKPERSKEELQCLVRKVCRYFSMNPENRQVLDLKE